jgi:hypothetical protein
MTRTSHFLCVAAMALSAIACSDSGKQPAKESSGTQEGTQQESAQNQGESPPKESSESSENKASQGKTPSSDLVKDMKAPIDKANAVQGVIDESTAEQRQEIDKATEQ